MPPPQGRARTRVGSTPDMGRLSAGVSRPGIDPRINSSYGYALADSVVDKDHGEFVDVALLPSELEITCRVPQAYAGKQFGQGKGTIHQDDELLVVIPEGDPQHGGVIVCRFWNGAFPPPDLVVNNPDDVNEVVEKDKKWRAATSGDGTISLITEKKVFLGEEDAEENVIIGKTFREKQKTMDDSLKQGFDQLSQALSSFSTDLTTLGTSLTFAGLLIPAAAVVAKAAVTAFTVAGQLHITAAQTAVDSLKSAVSTFESDAGSNQNLLSDTTFTKK